jgi:hypothetical protein
MNNSSFRSFRSVPCRGPGSGISLALSSGEVELRVSEAGMTVFPSTTLSCSKTR